MGNLLKANQVAAVFENSIMTTQINDLYQHLPIKHKNELKINGSILIKNGFHPGPNLGKILSQLEHEVIDLQVNNDTDKLLRRAKKISNNM